MSHELAKLATYLLSPLTLAMGIWLLAALCLALRRRRLAWSLILVAFVGLWVGSMPATAQALASKLESQYPPLSLEATPSADAIVVLGGALVGANPPLRPHFTLGPAAGRVWHAAQLYRAGKAKWVVIAAGNQPGLEGQQVEADAIAEMLLSLGVPEAAIRRESGSRNTRENAANVQGIVQGLGVRHVLLVTSAQHMPRAVRTFNKVWANSGLSVTPSPADAQGPTLRNSPSVWIPSPTALLSVTKALKEYAGMVALAIM
jgi:uncharacterized SAM-binding protein YcdF (DUF218 family)